MSDHATLLELGLEIGLDKATVEAVLETSEMAAAVNRDVNEAQQLGIRCSVFVLDPQIRRVRRATGRSIHTNTGTRRLQNGKAHSR